MRFHVAPASSVRYVPPAVACSIVAMSTSGFDVRDREADASLVAGGNAVLELLPRRAGVGRLVDRAAGPAAVEAERLAQPLVGRGVEHLRIARIHHEVGRAGERVDVEHLRPRAAGVGGLEHAALGILRPEVADRRDVRDVRVGGIEHDAPDRRACRAGRGRSTSSPRVGRAIDAAAPRRALAVVAFRPCRPRRSSSRPRRSRATPNVLSGCCAKTSFHVRPLFVDFQMPPVAAPT